MKRFDISSSENWVADNLILLANDLREISFKGDEPIFVEKASDISFKGDIPEFGEFIQLLNEEDEANDAEPPLRWSV